MSKPNNWREKREEQHSSHNRKAGFAAWYKEIAHRRNRRRSRKINNLRAEGKIPTFYDEKPLEIKERKPSRFKERPIRPIRIIDVLNELQIEELREIE